MRKKGNKAKSGKLVICPKCKYKWKTKQRGYICCSRCKRYFGGYNARKRKQKDGAP